MGLRGAESGEVAWQSVLGTQERHERVALWHALVCQFAKHRSRSATTLLARAAPMPWQVCGGGALGLSPWRKRVARWRAWV